jgi:cell wall-associated NlpC family hydrolase
MRITKSLWLTLVCVLVAALVAAGKVAAAPKKLISAHKRPHARNAPVLGPQFTRGQRAVSIARGMIGVPYRWGGSSPAGFDCSGLVMFAYGRLGVNLPHSSYELFQLGRRVGRWAMKPGDLVFFYGAGHVGIYLGHSRFVQATHSGDHVRISSLNERGYAAAFDGGRRIPGTARLS